MYSLLSGLWQQCFVKQQYQVLILGLDNAGKSTFMEQLRFLHGGGRPVTDIHVPPTVGLNIGKLDIGNSKLVVWDLGGQKTMRVIWDKYYSEAHAVIFVVDGNDPSRLSEAKDELNTVLSHRSLSDAPVLVLVNKQDLHNSQSLADVASAFKTTNSNNSNSSGESVAAANSMFSVLGASSLTGKGIPEVVKWLFREIPHASRTLRLSQEVLLY